MLGTFIHISSVNLHSKFSVTIYLIYIQGNGESEDFSDLPGKA